MERTDTWPVMVQQLRQLRDALEIKGVRSEVDGDSLWPRLRVYPSTYDHRPSAEFDNSIIVMSVIWYAFPWVEVIGRVEDPEESAARLVEILGEQA